MVTIFKDIYEKSKPLHVSVAVALERIKTGKYSKERIEQLRAISGDADAEKKLKAKLPCVCFSGEFSERFDDKMVKHSGFMVLDFDNVDDIGTKSAEIWEKKFIYAIWVSPRGNGLKCLVKIAEGEKHREHFQAIKEIFPDIDQSGINPSRVCYESYDPNLQIREDAEVFTKIKTVEKIESVEVEQNETEIFKKILKWISNKKESFSKGSRNSFIYKLASACCRFGINENNAGYMILAEFPTDLDFTVKEAQLAIKSAYRSNKGQYGTARFEKDILVDKVTRKEIAVSQDIYDLSVEPKDVVFGKDVWDNALKIYNQGYEKVKGINCPEFDQYFKSKKGEITLLSGHGNYGKSSVFKWMLLCRILLYGEKYALFSPEENPAEEFYNDFVEMLLGCNCTPYEWNGTVNERKPKEQEYKNAYDFVSEHIYYIYPKDLAPDPEYIKERFLELIIKKKVSGICIDPFNQLSHNYGSTGGRSDKYLETFLADFKRFALTNDVYAFIIAHPKQMVKDQSGNYPCPDVYDIADGAMWNNKMDNILIYHRPFAQKDPDSSRCEFHSKKIRKQKIVGKRGFLEFDYHRKTRRFTVDGRDIISEILTTQQLDFVKEVKEYKPVTPIKNDYYNPYAGFQRPSGNGFNKADWETN